MSEVHNAFLTGRLVLSVSHDGEGHWLKLQVPQALINGLFAAMTEPGVQPPPGLAHITVMTKDEVEKIGVAKISETGKSFPFRLSGVKHVDPTGWNGVSRCWFVEVKSPELKRLRASYGLSALPKGGHEFHVTFAIRRRGVLAPNSSVTKHAGLIPREVLMGAGGALGALAGGALARPKDKKQPRRWLQQAIGALMGGIGGVGLGYAASRQPVFNPTQTGIPAKGAPAVDNKGETRGVLGYEPSVSALPEENNVGAGLVDRYTNNLPAVTAGMGAVGGMARFLGYGAAGQPFQLAQRLARGAGSFGRNVGLSAGFTAPITGVFGTHAAQENLGVASGSHTMPMNLTGGLLAHHTTQSVLQAMNAGITRLVGKYAPTFAANMGRPGVTTAAKPGLSRIASGLGSPKAIPAAYAGTAILDTIDRSIDAFKTGTQKIYNDYATKTVGDAARYSAPVALARRFVRGAMSPALAPLVYGHRLAYGDQADVNFVKSLTDPVLIEHLKSHGNKLSPGVYEALQGK